MSSSIRMPRTTLKVRRPLRNSYRTLAARRVRAVGAQTRFIDSADWSHQSRTMSSTSRPTKSRSRATTSNTRGSVRARPDKLSISLGVDDVQWITRRAKRLGTSASAVIAGALAEQRRAEARGALLRALGEKDITDADLAAARREAFGP